MASKQLNTTPIQGADGQPINVGDDVIATTKMYGGLYFGKFLGWTCSDAKPSRSNVTSIKRTYTLYYQCNQYGRAYIREKTWGPLGTVPAAKTSRMARR